jgi:hypothetical protein
MPAIETLSNNTFENFEHHIDKPIELSIEQSFPDYRHEAFGSLGLAPQRSFPGKSSLQNLPPEILTQILHNVISDEGLPPIQTVKLFGRLLTTCWAIYEVGMPLLYRRVAFSHSRTFDKFRNTLQETRYGELVKVLDFSAFTSVGLGRTGKMNQEIQMVTSSTILAALESCPNLVEFLAAESVDPDIDHSVLNKLLEMPHLRAVDFCGSSGKLIEALIASNFVQCEDQPITNLTKISFHGCSTIPSAVFERIFPKLVNIKRLDLTHTQVTPEALLALPESLRLSHLSLAKCTKLDSHGLLKFLILHPATKYLTWLNLMFEATRPVPISRADFETIMRYLNAPLQYLNLYGLPVTQSHLRHLTKFDLRGLSLGHADINLQTLQDFLPQLPHLEYIDLTGNPNITMWTLQDPQFFEYNSNIGIFEFSADKLSKLNGSAVPGFSVEIGRGRRGWIRRKAAKPLTRIRSEREMAPASVGFSFANFALERLNRRTQKSLSSRASKADDDNSDTIDSGAAWYYASRKVNVSEIGMGGELQESIATNYKGIYSYYSYHH